MNEFIESNHCVICRFQHKNWISLGYLNKRNNRFYLIDNDDHGSYRIEQDKIFIKWDHWPQEIFIKKYISNQEYYYEHI